MQRIDHATQIALSTSKLEEKLKEGIHSLHNQIILAYIKFSLMNV